MKIVKQELISLINNKVFRSSKSAIIDKIQEELCVFGKFTVLDFNNIMKSIIPLEDLNDAELYWIMNAASKYLEAIKPINYYFEDAEIERYKNYTRNDTSKIVYPLVFTDAVRLSENQYAFPCSIGEIARLKYNGLLEVRPDLQREGKKDKYGDVRIYTNPKRVKELAKLYEDKEYAFNGIRFNLMDDGDSELKYNEDLKEITIKSGTIIIPDGNHRALATELIDPKKTCVDDRFIVFLTFFNVPKVKQTISQEWNIQQVNQSHKEFMKISNANKIVDAVKRNPDSDPLYVKKIVTTGREIQSGDGFILYDILSKSIDKYYKASELETQDARTEIAEWISVFLNRLTAILLNDFKNYYSVKKSKWSVNPYAFAGYILLSKHLRGKENWRNTLKDVLDRVDFSLEKSPLQNKTVKSNSKTMEMFFEEVAKDAGII